MSLPITFLTDYGVADDFAGVCRAVIARIAPGAQVIDISHGIGRHDVRQASAILADSLPYAPVGVHLAIVDPGVGGPRRAVAVRTEGDGHLLVGPDNGLLPPAVDVLGGAAEAVDISESPFRLEHPSATFHGRDLFAPVAANLALGKDLAAAGTPIDPESLERQPVSRPRLEQLRAFAHAERIDGFGNISLDLSRDDLDGHPLAGAMRVSVGSRKRRRTATRATSFEEVADGRFLFYEDSSGRMAIAVNRGDASEVLDLRVGDVVELEPAP
ncbi:MAG TPA: SAM-dependent chlorinase/fluorinase [Solirubrobacterales bacterium]|jgi:S-adenosylmethionine hydrolase|nr:SAM-dependent chlorinase/fluorinase [Solirubrobacterales bacterium]